MKRSVAVGVLSIQGAFAEHVKMLERVAEMKRRECGLEVAIVDVRQPEQIRESLNGLIIPGGESTTHSVFLKKGDFCERLRAWMRGRRKRCGEEEEEEGGGEGEEGEGGGGCGGVVWGTCTGLILLSDEVTEQKRGGQTTVGGLHIKCARNRYGRQVSSFEGSVRLQGPMLATHLEDHDRQYRDHHTTTTTLIASSTFLEEHGLERERCVGVFIRSPVITEVKSPSVTVLAVLDGAPPDKDSGGGSSDGGDATEGSGAGSDGGCEVVAVQQGNIMATSFHPELTRDPRWHMYFVDLVCQSKYPKTKNTTDI